MTTEARTPEEIERDIERDRARLTDNLESIQSQFSIDNAVRQIGDQLRLHGGDIGRSISDAAKQNPVALALTGVGIAWLMFGSGRRPDDSGGRGAQWAETDDRPYAPRVESAAYAGRPQPSPYGGGSRVARPASSPYQRNFDETPSWARAVDDFDDEDAKATAPSMYERARSAGASVSDRVSAAGASVGDAAKSTGASVSDRVSAAGASVGDAAKSTGAAISDRVSRARAMIGEGTETLSEEARLRVVAAREKALAARRAGMRSFDAASEASGDFYERQPFVAGALALAVGAAIGGALPRTKTEDDLVGAQSDRLMAEAERIFAEEYAKAERVVGAVVQEAKDMTSEARSAIDAQAPEDKTAAEAAAERAEGAVGRLAGAAKEAAEREDLGKPKL
jgi:hypothetical protein